mmetsp:Transcript_8193/g.19194  ORF Transcript_8193/g.19194 Transcript_8193/m.19194 type:complete len:152 (-) Transcript_8193:2215-2670(-)
MPTWLQPALQSRLCQVFSPLNVHCCMSLLRSTSPERGTPRSVRVPEQAQAIQAHKHRRALMKKHAQPKRHASDQSQAARTNDGTQSKTNILDDYAPRLPCHAQQPRDPFQLSFAPRIIRAPKYKDIRSIHRITMQCPVGLCLEGYAGSCSR